MLWWLLKMLAYLVIGMAVIWYWLFIGSAAHCPSCGASLERDYGYDGPLSTTVRSKWSERD